jgi:hypothetical protein
LISWETVKFSARTLLHGAIWLIRIVMVKTTLLYFFRHQWFQCTISDFEGSHSLVFFYNINKKKIRPDRTAFHVLYTTTRFDHFRSSAVWQCMFIQNVLRKAYKSVKCSTNGSIHSQNIAFLMLLIFFVILNVYITWLYTMLTVPCNVSWNLSGKNCLPLKFYFGLMLTAQVVEIRCQFLTFKK